MLLLALAGALAPLAAVPSLRTAAPLVIGLGITATLAWALLLYRTARGEGPPVSVSVSVGVLLRLALLSPDEGMSDDLYRYVWEGRVIAAGENPYARPPDDPALAPLRDEVVWPRVTHREVPAAYPPLSQAFFAGAAAIGLGPFGLRVALVAVDLAVLLALLRLLRRVGRDPRLVLAWGLSPLVVLEVAGSAHFDVLAVLFVVLAFHARAGRRPLAAAAWLGAATLAKPFAPLLLPFLLVREAWVRQGALFGGVVLAGFLPFAGRGGLDGLSRYAREWSHNSLLFPAAHRAAEAAKELAASWLESIEASEAIRSVVYARDPNVMARGALLVLLAIVVVRLARSAGDPHRRAALALGAFLLLAPTVHPWYLTWYVPLLAFVPVGPLVVWTGTVLLSYHVLPVYDAFGLWQESTAYRVAEYAPVLLWLAWDSVRSPGGPRAASSG